MKLLSYKVDVLASKLSKELTEAGVKSEEGLGLIVQIVETDKGPNTVQIGVSDDQDENVVKDIVEAHDPTPIPIPIIVSSDDVLVEIASLDPETATVADIIAKAQAAIQ